MKKRQITQRIDKLPFCKWHLLVIVSLGTTWVFDGYEVSMLSLVALQLKDEFNATESQIGLIASFYLAGCCSGALIFGVMTGLSVGGEYTAIFAAVDEFLPPQNRGFADVVIDGTWHFGSFLASICSILLFSNWSVSWAWRVMFLIGGLGSIPILFLRRNVPESPRWLLSVGQFEEAIRLTNYIEYCCKEKSLISMDDYSKLPLEKRKEIDEQIEEAAKLDFPKIEPLILMKKIFRTLFKIYPRRFFLGAVLMSCQAFFFQGIFYTFGMNLNQFYGVPKEDAGYYLIPLSVASFMGPVLLGRFIDDWGRKKSVFLFYNSVAILLVTMTIFFQADKLNLTGYIIFLSVIFVIASPGASSAHCIVSEIFPSEMRSQVLAVFFFVGFGFGGIIAPAIFGWIIEQKSRDYLAVGFYVSAGLMSFAGFVGGIWGINAEKKSLEDISDFNQVTVIKKDGQYKEDE